MRLTDGNPPDAETLARWWVQLNCWVWPEDMPGKPNPPQGLTREDLHMAIRGAHVVVDLFADEERVEALWSNPAMRPALTRMTA